MNTMTKKQAAEQWVSEWIEIPTAMINEKFEPLDYEGLVHITHVEHITDYRLPSLQTMWLIPPWDQDWILKNIDIAESLGIEVYGFDLGSDSGVLFGIDGAFSDIYRDYWIPLYEKRGFHKWYELCSLQDIHKRSKTENYEFIPFGGGSDTINICWVSPNGEWSVALIIDTEDGSVWGDLFNNENGNQTEYDYYPETKEAYFFDSWCDSHPVPRYIVEEMECMYNALKRKIASGEPIS
ncbi:hypothetical protein [Thermoactinomyces sp. DSM 45892]|uniref:hypothetical protein n=1 Tax=Thermoactinomyces sp. DSM 45892 TaxID=1882753 RepID=UPI0008975A56|nr:hypothetical protein [Thermoactinomyces sp. DSM 45892]SDZ06353.1 hypothetical protein SAMN05444416_112131 [Thermoactinomyces sp. DSM 45892]